MRRKLRKGENGERDIQVSKIAIQIGERTSGINKGRNVKEILNLKKKSKCRNE